jgi:hypothetical protein
MPELKTVDPMRFQPLSLQTFRIRAAMWQQNAARRITSVHVHHTYIPSHKDWVGRSTIVSMWNFHVNTKQWADIAQHVTIDPQGTIWTGRDWNHPPVSSTGHNGTSNAGPFMFEMVGDFDTGKDVLSGAQLRAALGICQFWMAAKALLPTDIRFHRQLGSPKTCPGSGIDYDDFMSKVIGFDHGYRYALSAAANIPV